jgi:hypothetical protein
MDSDGPGFAEIAETTSFLHYFSGLPDHHHGWQGELSASRRASFDSFAVFAGAEAFTDIARSGGRKIELPRRFRPTANGTPSRDHLGDIFATPDARAFQLRFVF